MAKLQITITDAGRQEVINATNDGTAPVTISEIGVGTGTYTPDPTQTALVAETKRLNTIAGEVVADDTIHVTIKDEGSDAYNVSEFGLYTSSGTLFAVYSDPNGAFIQKSAASTMLLAVDIILGTLDATNLTFGDTSFSNPPASETVAGVVELATPAEVIAGADGVRAVTPAGLAAAGATKLRTARTLTIGNTSRSFDGSANVSWSLAEILGNGVPATAIELGSGVDLNTIQTPGFYVQPLDVQAASGANYPVPYAGALMVLRNAGVTQIYCTYGVNSRMFFRSYYGNTGWYAWREFYHSGNIGVATESSAGIVELATAAEAQSLASAAVALTPARLADAFKGANQSLSTNGYQKLPGGLIMQWGRKAIGDIGTDYYGSTTFPIAFPNTILQVNPTLYSYAGGRFDASVAVTGHSLTDFNFTIQEWSGTVQNLKVSYIAIGD